MVRSAQKLTQTQAEIRMKHRKFNFMVQDLQKITICGYNLDNFFSPEVTMKVCVKEKQNTHKSK